MRVLKRSGKIENVSFDKVHRRISKLTTDPLCGPPLSSGLDCQAIAQQVFTSMFDEIRTAEIDDLSAECAVALQTRNPEYETLAMRIVGSNIQKMAPPSFLTSMRKLRAGGIITDEVVAVAANDAVRSALDPSRDFSFTYFGLKTLEKAYLTKLDGKIMETPQFMFMRVSIGIHGDDIPAVLETYDRVSRGFCIHATPTLFNAGTPRPQMSSCFLLANKSDSIDGIYGTITEAAQISKWAGGLGIHAHDVRANGSYIRGTNGQSDGVVPMLRVLNATARYVNQAGKRKGSFAIYLEPHHADIMDFLQLRLNQGDEDARCRDLFTALWTSDEFMRRVEADEIWSLFCPDEAKGLSDVYGDEYVALYKKYEEEGKARRQIPAREVWAAILKSQVETGTPYVLYKDAANRKTNQKNIGIIKSSNLCSEILEVSTPDETAVCNLASIALPRFVREDGTYDFDDLHAVAKMLTKNLNRVIDRNFYPVETARRSNMRHRPIGIGVQGLADVFFMSRYAFDSPEARKLNAAIFEAIYHGALEASCELAETDGPYETFEGSPLSAGVLQQDMWATPPMLSGRYDWDAMRERVKRGARNSLLIAPMPTASTAQILGNNEAFEPITTNIYVRRTLAGEFVCVNKHLVRDLQRLGLWDSEGKMKDLIVRSGGSVQHIREIPDDIKAIYKTVWEISQKTLIDLAADRGHYVCQTQSMNLFLESPTYGKLGAMHMYAWKSGLKTGMYYLRTQPKAKAQQFTLDPESCAMCSA